jgi:transcriptional regulator with XRE-family HTH domain
MYLCIFLYLLHMPDTSLQSRALRAASIFRQLGITQTEVATTLGASQGQVSRILRGQNLRPSRLFEEVCLLAERQSTGVTAEAVRESSDLIEALRATWDGSAIHARALASVIRSLSALSSPIPMPPEYKE